MAGFYPTIVSREDPLIVFQFGLELSGMIEGFFTECSGISSYHDVTEQQAVNHKGHAFVMKAPGILKDGDITLKRGITSNFQVWEWRALVEAGDMANARKNCSIIMFNRKFETIARWNFVNAWPTKVAGPEFSSSTSEFGIEEMVLTHEGFFRVV
jgi:phage tail-like protein